MESQTLAKTPFAAANYNMSVHDGPLQSILQRMEPRTDTFILTISRVSYCTLCSLYLSTAIQQGQTS